MAAYGSYKFYTLFDFTGHQNLFVTPSISVDVGEKVNSRLVQLIYKFTKTPDAGDLNCYVYHYVKRLIEWKPNMAMRLVD